jgi:RNA polymerase sigma factor (sigma-70 family)
MSRITPDTEKNRWILNAIETHQSALISYAERLLGNHDSAKDVVQDTFLKLCKEDERKVEQYLAPWLYRVVRNQALNLIRKENRMIQTPDPDKMQVPSSSESKKGVCASLFELILTLPEKQSELLMLKFADGFSYKEISKITGMSVSNVGYILHHGLKELKARWETQENQPKQESGI